MSTLRKRLDTVEDRIAIQQHRELERQFKGWSEDEQAFFCIHGYWPDQDHCHQPMGRRNRRATRERVYRFNLSLPVGVQVDRFVDFAGKALDVVDLLRHKTRSCGILTIAEEKEVPSLNFTLKQ